MNDLFDDIDEVKDYGRIRKLKLSNNELIFEQEDPYGFWSVHFAKGQVPNTLKTQKWTTYNLAEEAVMNYLKNKDRVKEIKQEV